jgi:hypothetical protein
METDPTKQLEPTPRQVSAYEFVILEGQALWAKLKEPKNIDVGAVLIAASVLGLAGVVGEGLRLLNGTLTTHNEVLLAKKKAAE